MIIKDYKTPDGRLIITERPAVTCSPCKTRPMTAEEREKYGVDEWQKDKPKKEKPQPDNYFKFTW